MHSAVFGMLNGLGYSTGTWFMSRVCIPETVSLTSLFYVRELLGF